MIAAASDGEGRQRSRPRQVFRSPAAVAIWWLWVLFAVGNLIDLAVQGRDHLSLVAAFILLFVTGVVYVTAQRPRVDRRCRRADDRQPARATTGSAGPRSSAADATELLRVRCEWPDGDRTGQPGHLRLGGALLAPQAGRRRDARAAPAAAAAARGGGEAASAAFGGYGAPPGSGRRTPDPLGVDADQVIAALTARRAGAGGGARRAGHGAGLTWNWPAVAAVVVPGLALLIAVLA